MGLLEVLTVIFIVLKLFGVVTLSWWFVLSPLIASVIIAIIYYYYISRNDRRGIDGK